MMTPDRARRILNRLGFPLSRRKLTDWIAKGLIPHLSDKGKGYGLGKTYFWKGSIVLEQLLAASDLMLWHSRSENVRLVLWFNGYEVDACRIRDSWVDILRAVRDGISTKYADPFDLEEKIDRNVFRVTRRVSNGTPDLTTTELLKLIFKTFASGTFDLMDQVNTRSLQTLAKSLAGDSTNNESVVGMSRTIQNVFTFLHENFSPMAKVELVESASNEDLFQAQRDWGNLVRCLATLLRATTVAADSAWPDIKSARLWWRLLSHFGGTGILLILALRRQGFGRQIEQSIELLEDNIAPLQSAVEHIRANDLPYEAESQKFIDVVASLQDIWLGRHRAG